MIDIPSPESLNLAVALPVASLLIGALLLLVVELLLPKERQRLVPWLALAIVLISLGFTVANFDVGGAAFGGMFVADRFTGVVNLTVLITTGLSILLAIDYLRRTGMARSDYYLLLLFTASSIMFMAGANDLIMVFVALELLSIPLYVLSGFRRPELKSEEAALKYFLLGVFATGFLVYGIALIYGATGSTRLPAIWDTVQGIIATGGGPQILLLILGAGLVTAALGFKVAAVPFHMWTPDVYEGAPTSVTAFMSVGAKLGGFAALLRVLLAGLSALTLSGATAAAWQDTIAILAAATLILGNVVAITQTNIKRLLAYSSIAHAGYVLMAVAAAGSPAVGDQGAQAALIYLLAYAFTNLGAFAVAIAVERDDGSGVQIDDFRGLARRRPYLGLQMALYMFSLTGIPLTAGFVGKWYVFWATLDAGLGLLAVIGVLTSVVAAFYYLRIIVRMYLEEGEADAAMPRLPGSLRLALGLAALGTLIFGVLPFLLADLAGGVQIAVAALGGG